MDLEEWERLSKIYAEENIEDFELVALNASGDLNTLAHLFKYDSFIVNSMVP